MHKNQDKNFAAEKQRKREKRTRKRPKRAKPGAFRVLEGMRTVKGRCKRMGKTGKLGGNRGTDLSRLPPRSVRGRAPLALAHPTTRTAQGAAAPRCRVFLHTNKKQRGKRTAYLSVFGRGRRTRTLGTRFWRPLLYQLSYTPIFLLDYLIILWRRCQPLFLRKAAKFGCGSGNRQQRSEILALKSIEC